MLFSLIFLPAAALLIGCSRTEEHPSSAQLLQQWREHRAELDQLVQMFMGDKALNRVALDFTRPDDPSTAGVTPGRIAEYRRLLETAGVRSGIEGYGGRDMIWFYVSTLGLSVSGSAKGVAFVQGTPDFLVPDLDAHVTKALSGPSRSFTAFQRIEGNWYLYFDYED